MSSTGYGPEIKKEKIKKTISNLWYKICLFFTFVFLKMKMNAGPSQESVRMGVVSTLLGAIGVNVMKDFNQVPQASNVLVSGYASILSWVNKTSVL